GVACAGAVAFDAGALTVFEQDLLRSFDRPPRTLPPHERLRRLGRRRRGLLRIARTLESGLERADGRQHRSADEQTHDRTDERIQPRAPPKPLRPQRPASFGREQLEVRWPLLLPARRHARKPLALALTQLEIECHARPLFGSSSPK